MRTTLLALVLAATACKSDEAPKVSAAASTAVAGTVVDVKGTVTVAGKPLAKGDTVTADTTIDTGADSSVTILLAHNGVKLEVAANKHVRVNESVAWKAPTRVEPGAGPDEATMSAGRPAERNAAETTATATAVAPQAAVETAPAPGGAPDGRADKGATDTKDREEKKSTESPRNEPLDGERGGGLGLTGVGKGGGGAGDGIGGVGTIGHGGGGGTGAGKGYGAGKGSLGGSTSAPTVTPGKASVSGSISADIIRRIVRVHLPKIKCCSGKWLGKNPSFAGKLNMKFTISPEGTVVQATDSGGTINDIEVVACAAKVFMDMGFPKPTGGGIVTVTYPIVFAPSK